MAGLSAMKTQDVGVVFLAGHGFKPPTGDMVYATGDLALKADGHAPSEESLASAGLRWSDVASALRKAKGRVVVLLDACHSGHVTRELVVPNDALATDLVRTGQAGVLVFAAAKGRQVSFEPPIPAVSSWKRKYAAPRESIRRTGTDSSQRRCSRPWTIGRATTTMTALSNFRRSSTR